MRIIIAGGGTGGHVFPAISVANEISERNEGDEILFVGTKRGMENELVVKHGYEIKHISSKGFVGRGLLNKGLASVHAIKGLLDSASIIKDYKPDVVLGVGGYVSGPFLMSAVMLRVPTAICEQNTVPGVTNRILGRFVDKIFASFDSSVQFFPSHKVHITGNPIRKDILNSKVESSEGDSINILIFGGSQGATSLNRSLPQAFSKIKRENINIVHQTGKKDLDLVSDLYDDHGIDASVHEFIHDMAEAYSKAHLVIGRAGAGTIAEITALGKPSILVPFPFAAHDHQLENAKILHERQAAFLIEDKYATPEKLAQELENILQIEILESMSEQSKRLGKPQASKDIVDTLYKMAGVGR
ncbi:MAG: undecaprenyldiphospho-muramoylpentapeptide beta-N-acetylglucosaminyltransferase [Thermodesulfobacteriota bacterium]